jgi:hypothetical protein
MRIDEVSDDWNRCCCGPYHPLRLEAREYIPMPDSGRGDYAHLSSDIIADFRRFQDDHDGRRQFVRNMYRQRPVLFSIVRDDGQRCCCKVPCKVLNTFVFCGCCQDGAAVYAGEIQDGPEIGRYVAATLFKSTLIQT